MSGLHHVVIGLGSNCGDTEANVTAAIGWLEAGLSSFRCSGVYHTPALDPSEPPYCNAVASGITGLSPEALGRQFKEYERQCGRAPGHVVIDLDIVMCDGAVLRPADYSRAYFTIGYRRIPDSAANL